MRYILKLATLKMHKTVFEKQNKYILNKILYAGL